MSTKIMATKGTMTPREMLVQMIEADPILKFLANGGSWAEAAEMEEAERLKRAVESIPKWEAQLEAVLRKPQNPSALRHKARLVESLREAYEQAGRDAGAADAYLAAAEAKVKAAAGPRAPGGGEPPAKPRGAWAALVDSDEE